MLTREIKLDAVTAVEIAAIPRSRVRLSIKVAGVTLSAKEISYHHAQQISEALCSVVCAAVGEPDPFPSIPGR